jgi:hypothetical protein
MPTLNTTVKQALRLHKAIIKATEKLQVLKDRIRDEAVVQGLSATNTKVILQTTSGDVSVVFVRDKVHLNVHGPSLDDPSGASSACSPSL